MTEVGGMGALTKTRRFPRSPTQAGCYMCTSPDGHNPREPRIKPKPTQATGSRGAAPSSTDKAWTSTSASLASFHFAFALIATDLAMKEPGGLPAGLRSIH